jgi:hypothetical protein
MAHAGRSVPDYGSGVFAGSARFVRSYVSAVQIQIRVGLGRRISNASRVTAAEMFKK